MHCGSSSHFCGTVHDNPINVKSYISIGLHSVSSSFTKTPPLPKSTNKIKHNLKEKCRYSNVQQPTHPHLGVTAHPPDAPMRVG